MAQQQRRADAGKGHEGDLVLRRLYHWEGPLEVKRMLVMHPEAGEALARAAAIIPTYFGPDATLSLRVVRELDGDGSERLFAYIHTHQAPGPALDSLQRFDDGWWLDEMPRSGGVLSFALRFA
jgi:hypothetical protein